MNKQMVLNQIEQDWKNYSSASYLINGIKVRMDFWDYADMDQVSIFYSEGIQSEEEAQNFPYPYADYNKGIIHCEYPRGQLSTSYPEEIWIFFNTLGSEFSMEVLKETIVYRNPI